VPTDRNHLRDIDVAVLAVPNHFLVVPAW
jgi:hypothetical protein